MFGNNFKKSEWKYFELWTQIYNHKHHECELEFMIICEFWNVNSSLLNYVTYASPIARVIL